MDTYAGYWSTTGTAGGFDAAILAAGEKTGNICCVWAG